MLRGRGALEVGPSERIVRLFMISVDGTPYKPRNAPTFAYYSVLVHYDCKYPKTNKYKNKNYDLSEFRPDLGKVVFHQTHQSR
jgi:hypothetical protein